MKQVIKGDGSIVPFDRQKLVLSMRAAGASEARSEEVARAIERSGDRISTQEMRLLVIQGLDARERAAAERYDATRRLVARRAIEAPSGMARLPSGVMASLRLGQGEVFQLRNDGRVMTVQAELNERTVIGKNEVRLNAKDMEVLEVEDGQRIILVRRSPEQDAQDRSHESKRSNTTLRGGRSLDVDRPPTRGVRRSRRKT